MNKIKQLKLLIESKIDEYLLRVVEEEDKSSKIDDVGIPDDTDSASFDTATSIDPVSDTGKEGESSSMTTGTDSTEGSKSSTTSSGTGSFISGGGGFGGSSDAGGIDATSATDQTTASGEEAESEIEDPIEKFKKDFDLLISKKNDVETVEKFLKASLQDKQSEERNEYLKNLDKYKNNSSVKKAKENLNNFFNKKNT